jgi:hypothetical protein
MMAMVNYACKRCGVISTRIRPHAAGGKAPRFCDDCAVELRRAQARERYHELKAKGVIHVKNNKTKG